MALRDDLPILKKVAKSQIQDRELNKNLFEIYEGDLQCQLEEKLRDVFSPQTYEELLKFLIPINVLPKVIDKLTKIYQQDPTREVLEGTDQDKELLTWYDVSLDTNASLNVGNEYYNISKSVLLEPYLEGKEPRLRSISKDKFFVYSNNPVNPTVPTHISVILRQFEKLSGDKVSIYATWTKDEMLVWDDDYTIHSDIMALYGIDPSGVNPIGAIPYVYVNRSPNKLIPKTDSDTLTVILELPSQLSWLNMAIGYNCFPINYVIDADIQDLKRVPNVLWRLNSDKTSDKQPVVGSVKPEVDISEAMQFIQSTFAMWLNTKGLRPGAIGDINPEVAASGIAKLVDESDTSENRKAQVVTFRKAEKQLWDLIFNYIHPYWVRTGQIENRTLMSVGARVVTNFAEQKPLVTRSQIISDVKAEMELGLEDKKGAMKRLNPHMTNEQIEKKLEEVEEEKQESFKRTQEFIAPNDNQDKGAQDEQDEPEKDDETA